MLGYEPVISGIIISSIVGFLLVQMALLKRSERRLFESIQKDLNGLKPLTLSKRGQLNASMHRHGVHRGIDSRYDIL